MSSVHSPTVPQLDQEIRNLQERMAQVLLEKKNATYSKAINDTSIEEMARVLKERVADKKKQEAADAAKAIEDAARARNYDEHQNFTEHENPEVRGALSVISKWAKDEVSNEDNPRALYSVRSVAHALFSSLRSSVRLRAGATRSTRRSRPLSLVCRDSVRR